MPVQTFDSVTSKRETTARKIMPSVTFRGCTYNIISNYNTIFVIRTGIMIRNESIISWKFCYLSYPIVRIAASILAAIRT
ncbi:hypothetical protein V7103_01270, partial [Neobacillus drentensis]|uniref:hypothetical protein n=1 Tax=Neobacillus drentensis TaxID=220684 RepID=UPI002FFFAF91